jgi:hypothetical protein
MWNLALIEVGNGTINRAPIQERMATPTLFFLKMRVHQSAALLARS